MRVENLLSHVVMYPIMPDNITKKMQILMLAKILDIQKTQYFFCMDDKNDGFKLFRDGGSTYIRVIPNEEGFMDYPDINPEMISRVVNQLYVNHLIYNGFNIDVGLKIDVVEARYEISGLDISSEVRWSEGGIDFVSDQGTATLTVRKPVNLNEYCDTLEDKDCVMKAFSAHLSEILTPLFKRLEIPWDGVVEVHSPGYESEDIPVMESKKRDIERQ